MVLLVPRLVFALQVSTLTVVNASLAQLVATKMQLEMPRLALRAPKDFTKIPLVKQAANFARKEHFRMLPEALCA